MPGPGGGRSGSRFEMLINVSVGGMEKFKGLSKESKLAAKHAKTLGEAIKATGTDIEDAKVRMKNMITTLGKYQTAEQKYIAALKIKNRLSEKEGKLSKNQVKDLKAANTALKRTKTAMMGYRDEINKAKEGTIKFNAATNSHTSQQSKLKRVIEQLQADYNKITKAENKNSRARRKNTAETKKNSAAHSSSAKNVKINAHAFNQLSQRITNAETGFAGLRRRLGAIRNQL